MDMMGYGSHTVNFNPHANSMAPTYYSDAFYQGPGSMSAQALNIRNSPGNVQAV